MLAQLRSSYEGGLAQLRASYEAEPPGITLVVDVDAGNADGATSTITDPTSDTPTIWIEARTAAVTGSNGDGWRHLHFAVENAEGKRPVFRLNRATMTTPGTAPTADWRPFWTQDFQAWTRAPSRTLVGGSTGYIEFQFTDPLPGGRVYIATQPLGRQADAIAFADELLSFYPAVAAPTASADPSGVFFTSPAETDEASRPIGSNPMYAIRLDWGGSTTDGAPKRRLVMLAGVHSAGEATSWVAFVAAVRWMLDDVSPAAQDFRANWQVFVYFNVTPNGIVGGHRRHNFRVSTDANRDFNAKSLAEVAALTAAAESDTGGAHAMLSWHAYSSQTNLLIPGTVATPNQATLSFIAIAEGIFGATQVDYKQDIPGADYTWGYNVLGCKVAFAAECQQRGDTQPSTYEFIGESWMRTVQAADAAGLFTGVDLSADGGAEATGLADLAATVALAGVGVVAAGGSAQAAIAVPLSATGISVSGGGATLSANVSISALGIAQAAGAAGLSATVLLAAAGAAAAAGDAELAAALRLAASGGATAGGSAALVGGEAGDLAASGGAAAGGDAVLRLVVRLAATGGGVSGGTALLEGGSPGDLAATGGAITAGAAELAVEVALSAVGFARAMGAGQLVVQVPLAASGGAVSGGAATLSAGDPVVLISTPRYTVDAPGRRFVVERRA